MPHPFARRTAIADAASLVEGMKPAGLGIERDVEQLIASGPAIVFDIIGEKLLGDLALTFDEEEMGEIIRAEEARQEMQRLAAGQTIALELALFAIIAAFGAGAHLGDLVGDFL